MGAGQNGGDEVPGAVGEGGGHGVAVAVKAGVGGDLDEALLLRLVGCTIAGWGVEREEVGDGGVGDAGEDGIDVACADGGAVSDKGGALGVC